MLRVEESFEVPDLVLRACTAPMRHYDVVEQVFERPLWIAHVLPMRGPAPEVSLTQWRRFVASSMRGLLGIVLNPQWDRVRVHAMLPSFMLGEQEIRLARCTEIWDASSLETPGRGTWIFDTECGVFADPEFCLELQEVRRESLQWRDFESDWDSDGRLKG